MRRLLASLALLLAIPAAASARPAMWTVRDADSEIVLFGSIHVLPPGLDWRPPALIAALGQADDLWFELPFDAATQQRFAVLAQQRGQQPPGRSLSPALSRTGRARLLQICKKLNINPAEIDRMQPWLAEVRLSLAALAIEEAGAEDGVEPRIAAAAPPRLRREAFETPEQQIALFADAPLSEQVASLERTLKEIGSDPAGYRRLVAAWMSGNPRAVEKEGLDPLRKDSPASYRRLVSDRNARWVEILRRRMAGSGRTVVVVGAGHLAGPDGVPARLRALGFKVEGP